MTMFGGIGQVLDMRTVVNLWGRPDVAATTVVKIDQHWAQMRKVGRFLLVFIILTVSPLPHDHVCVLDARVEHPLILEVQKR